MAGKKRRTNARAKSTGRIKRSSAEELERIEDLLGEDFDTLTQARAALARETGPRPGKQKYRVSELSQKKTVSSFVKDIERPEKIEEIDALKRDQDYFAAKIYGHNTYNVYGSIEQLAKKLGTYKGLASESPKESLKHIQVIKIKGRNGLREWRKQKAKQIEKKIEQSHKDRKTIARLKKQIKKLRANR